MAQTGIGAGEVESLADRLNGWIVVGHDGSERARAALGIALDLASRLDAPLGIVRVWRFDTAPSGTVFREGYASSFQEIGASVRAALERDVADTLAAHPAVRAECFAQQGPTAQTLVATSTHARMLVLGRRGLGGFATLLLGSVSEQCVRHATCPVLVV